LTSVQELAPGVGEVLRRILGKTMALATGMDVQEKCGTDQLCSRIKAGIEDAVHILWDLFEEKGPLSGGCQDMHLTQSTGKLHCGFCLCC